MRSLLSGLLALAALLTVLIGTASAATAGLPPLPTAPEGDLPGVNDWSCAPSVHHPEPVVLVHGTFGDRRHLLEPLSETLVHHGYCVYALDYGNRATEDVAASAKTLAAFVTRVRHATGAGKVDLIGHSQGGMMPRYYIKDLGGAAYVDDLVGLAPSNHGTRVVTKDSPLFGAFCAACDQQAWGSDFLQRLNAGDETPGPVSYTQIESRYDEVVVPYTSAFLEPGPRTTNVLLQRRCPALVTDHLLIPMNKVAIEYTLDALAHPGPASRDFAPVC